MRTFAPAPFSALMRIANVAIPALLAVIVLPALAIPGAAWIAVPATVLTVAVFAWAISESPTAYELPGGGALVVHGRFGRRFRYRVTGARRPAPRLGLRLLGTSGFFGHTGWYRDAEGRRVRAFLTTTDGAVSLDTDRGPVVVSPADPEGFVAALGA